MATYNEERFIAGCIDHLHQQGVDVYLCDNSSTDATVEIASRRIGRGLLQIESIPRDGVYRWREILERKEEIAARLDADWFLHLDADEVPLPPRRGMTLRDAITEADSAGCNAIEFSEFTFVPTAEDPDHDHPEFRRSMRWFYEFEPKAEHLLRGWKRQTRRVDLATTGGHAVRFGGRRVFAERFRLLHYLFLSQEHAQEKYGARCYDQSEVRAGWHGWRAKLRADSIRLPSRAELRYVEQDDDVERSSPRTRHCLEWDRA